MTALRMLLAAALGFSSVGAVSVDSPRALRFVRARGYDHHLRVCNAYPNQKPMDIYRGEHKLTEAGPLPYASCRDFQTVFQAGDTFDFKLGGANAGLFSISSLPDSDAILLLVVYRHDARSTAVAFKSHIFANLANSQIAVIDTYKGAAKAKFSIADDDKMAKFFNRPSTQEYLKMNSVMAVNAGIYNVSMYSDTGDFEATRDVVATNRESYVLLRTGLETDSESYPAQFVFYPKSEHDDLPEDVRKQVEQAYNPKSGAAQTSAFLLLLLPAVFAAMQ